MACESIKFWLNIVKTKQEIPIYLKLDFKRFFSPLTLKLEADSLYRIQFGLSIAYPRIRQILLNENEVPFRKYISNDTMIYVLHWDTSGIVPSPNKTRCELTFTLLYDDNMHFEVSFQVKYYKKNSDRLANWSKPMSLIWFEAELDRAQARYFLVNTTY